MAEIVITRGYPASGKTTWALAWVAESPSDRARVNRDELRSLMFGKVTGLSHEQEKLVTGVQRSQIYRLVKAGYSVVVDDTNLRLKTARGFANIAKELGVDFRVQDFDLDAAMCISNDFQRAISRQRAAGHDVITNFAERYGPPSRWPEVKADEVALAASKRYYPNTTFPMAYIFDLDGTLAHMNGRNPYDWTRVEEDVPDEGVRRIAAVLASRYKIIILSGRDASCRQETQRWLWDHTVRFDNLFMRPAGDTRKDSIIKEEIFFQDVAPFFNVLGVFDDRDQVVAMWRRLGLQCFQVAYGNF